MPGRGRYGFMVARIIGERILECQAQNVIVIRKSLVKRDPNLRNYTPGSPDKGTPLRSLAASVTVAIAFILRSLFTMFGPQWKWSVAAVYALFRDVMGSR